MRTDSLDYNMRERAIKLAFAILLLCASMPTSNQANEPKNVLLICVDDLRPELGCFGVNYIQSPNIDRLAAAGRSFHRHYVNAPSCGCSRYTLLTGRYGPANNNALFLRAKKVEKDSASVPPSMPRWYRSNGYTTVSVGKVSHHPGGRGGPDWDDDSVIEMPNAWDRHLMPCGAWKHPRGAMHGLANGEIRQNKGEIDIFQATLGPDSIYPDGLIADEALVQLDELTNDAKKPFFLAVGLIKPHLPFGAPKKYFELYEGVELPPIPYPVKPKGISTWNNSGEFMGQYNRWGKDPRQDANFATEVRRHYAACVSYADASVGRIIEKLKQTGADKNTIIVLWGDHGWCLGEHAIWGKHNLFEEALRSPLIIVAPEMNLTGEKTNAVVETLDIFPTLCELTGVSTPDFIQGVSLKSILEHPESTGHPAVGYWGDANTVRTPTHRLVAHKNGGMELYDHTTAEKETVNLAEKHPELVMELKKQLSQRLSVQD